MFQEYFRDSEWLTLPLATLVFFFVWFLVVLWRVCFRMRDPARNEALASMPLSDEFHPDRSEEAHHG